MQSVKRSGADIEIRLMVDDSRFSAMVWDILDEVLLILGGGVDGRTLSGLGLLTTGNGEPRAGEHAAEGSHGELLRRGGNTVNFHVSQVPARSARRKG